MLKKLDVRFIFLLIILFVLPVFQLSYAAETDLEKDLQQDLQQSKTIIQTAEKKLKSGSPVTAEIDQLKELAEKIRASHLLLQERFRTREGVLKTQGTKAQDRHREMEEGYSKALGDYLNLIESLPVPEVQSTEYKVQGLNKDQIKTLNLELRTLNSLLDRILPKKKRPIFGSLPYKNLNYPAREPIATPVIKPAYKGGNKVISPDDTKNTEEAPISEEIASLAQSLNWKPVAINEYVKNNIETEWYWGCMKGAEETLRQKSGNDCDQATLLTALLRASGFPTRYIRGTMEFFMGGRDGVSLDKAKNLVGIDDPAKIAEFFQKAGIPYRPVIQGGKITNFQIEHIWVESRIPYGNYRGTMIDNSNPRWLGLDTSIKLKGYEYNSPADIYEHTALSEQLSGIRDKYLSEIQPETPLEYLKSFIDSRLGESPEATELTYDNFLRSRNLIIKPLSIIPDSMQFDQKLITHEYTELPEELKHRVRLFASRQYAVDSMQDNLFEITLDTMYLSNKMIAITYEPETVEDQQIIDSYGGLDNTPAYLVRLRPVLTLDGERMVVGKDGLSMGSEYELTIELISPNSTEKITNTHIAGNLAVIGLTAQKTLSSQLPALSEDDDAEQLLYEEAMNYIDRWNRSEEELASLLHLTISRPIPTVVTVGGVIDVTYLLDMPHGFEWKGIYVDAALRAVSPVQSTEYTVQNDREKLFMQISALEGSILENRIFEDDFQVDSISTAKLFQLCYSDSELCTLNSVLTIDKTNIDTILPTLFIDENIEEDIINSVNQNLAVRIPVLTSRFPFLTYKDWSGLGYIKENLETGEAGYMLSGMIAGGMTTVRKEDWIDQDIKNALSQPTSKKTNTDSEAAIRIARLNIKEADNKSGIVGTKMNKPFEVIALDKNGAPVQNVIITFKTIAGGGKVQGVSKDGNPISDINTGTSAPASEITVKTGPDGIARAKLTLGEQTSVSPYYRVETNINNEPYWELTGLNLVSVNATTIKKGVFYTDKPFEAYGRPGEAEKIEKTSPLSEIYGIPNLFATTVWLKVMDKYGNSISNKQVKISVQDDPSTGKNAKLYANLDDCKGTPNYSCEEAKIYDSQNPLIKTTEHFGAMAFLILGNTEKTKYTVTVTAKKDKFNKLGKRVDTDVDLVNRTFNFYTKSMGGADAVQYLSVMSAYSIDEKGNNIDAGTAGKPFSEPLKAAVYLSQEGYETDVKENCTENCYYLKGTGVFETTLVNDGKVEFKVISGGGNVITETQTDVDLDLPGHYSTVLILGTNPSTNVIRATGTKTITVPTIDPVTGVEGQTQKELSGITNIEVWGLKITFPPDKTIVSNNEGYASYQMIALNDSGYLSSDLTFEYKIEPIAYKCASQNVQLDIFEKDNAGTESWVGFAPADNAGKLILSQGTVKFNMDNTYYAQVVLNRGTKAEVRSEKILLVNSALIPDYNRDGKIDDSDRRRSFAGDKFYFWINDDDDEGETEGTDVPGTTRNYAEVSYVNHENYMADGIRDLIDFFPVYMDIRGLIKVFDMTKYTYKLQSEDESINFVFTDIKPDRARDYLTGNEDSLEPAPTLGNAVTYKLNSDGILLNNHVGNPTFLDGIRNNGKGIILIEGSKTSQKPLELSVYDDKQNKVISLKLNLSLDGVEQMFRHKNLTQYGVIPFEDGPVPKAGSNTGELDRLDQPLNYPDKECTGSDLVTGKNFVFVHGYNVNGKQARGWQAEMFKRMFWSGSKAKFWGVTWYGWDSQEFLFLTLPFTPNYHVNVVHAFNTVPEFQNFLSNTVEGEITIAAHSLGNMVVSAALTNDSGDVWDASGKIKNYFMLDAAVASEAYGSLDNNIEAEMNKDTVTNPNMTHPLWNGYEKRLWSSEWHLLFDDADNRKKLTWRNIFSNRPSSVKYYNFYSSGEEVLDVHTGVPNILDIGIFKQKGRYAWALQEKLKGDLNLNTVLGSKYGGWGFNITDTEYYFWGIKGNPAVATQLPILPEEAAMLKSPQLRTRPFFLIGNEGDLYKEDTGSNYALQNHIRLLADAFPARTLAAGKQAIPAFEDLNRDFDMQTTYKTTKKVNGKNVVFWPSGRGEENNWRHGDAREVAYSHVYLLFDKFVEFGGLK